MQGYETRALSGLTAHVQPGPKVILQHGLCGSAAQPAEVFPQGHGFGHAVLECRGHGQSPLGDPSQIALATFTDDLAALATTVNPVAVGGISMGAALALRLAVTRPDLVPALILSRPAWVTDAAPANMQPNAVVGRMIAQGRSLADFDATDLARHLALHAPDNLASLRGFFNREPLAETATLLTRISAQGPDVSPGDLAALDLPTLILASDEDVIHPFAHAVTLSRLIPGAVLVDLPPKGRDKAAHVAACQAAILQFLKGLPHDPKP